MMRKSERIGSPWCHPARVPLALGTPGFRSADDFCVHDSRRQSAQRVALVVHRRAITQRRMTAIRVVPTLQPGKHGPSRIDLAMEALAVDDLSFQGGEKRLGHRVIVSIADTAHRGPDARLRAALAKGVAGVLAAAGRVMGYPPWPAPRDRHVQGGPHQPR